MARVLEPEVMDAAGEALAYDELERVLHLGLEVGLREGELCRRQCSPRDRGQVF